MRLFKMTCMVLAFTLLLGAMSVPVKAAETQTTAPETFPMDFAGTRATGPFQMTVPAKTKALANSSLPLAAGETVTIKASYTPSSASMDFGLVAPDGTFYYFNVTSGRINKTIEVSENGDYILQVRNNSSGKVEVTGTVNY